MNLEEDTLVLTQHTYIETLRHAPKDSNFYYKKDSANGFNVKKIQDVMSPMGVTIMYKGEARHVGRGIHQLKVVRNNIPPEVSPKELENVFFDPKNLI